jgi:hypothetical protein
MVEVLFRRPLPEPCWSVPDTRFSNGQFRGDALARPAWMCSWQVRQTTRVTGAPLRLAEAVVVFVVRLGEGWGDGQRRLPSRASKTPPRSSLPRACRPAIEARAQSATQ